MNTILIFLATLTSACLAATPCAQKYQMIGCFQEDTPGKVLVDKEHVIDWKDLAGFLRGISCKCAEAAKKQGFAGFAMRYQGQCYGRSKEQITILMSKEHQAHICNGEQRYVDCFKGEHQHCMGKENAEAVYQFIESEQENVDGGFGEWRPWTQCDKECGDGFMYRERNCDSPPPKGTGKDCTSLGPFSERRACKMKDCPVDGGYSKWGEYSECTRSCGGGIKTRQRSCSNPEPKHGGKNCSILGPGSETIACNEELCPVDGGWSDYGPYGACTKSCGGGVKYRHRTCTNPVPSNGGFCCPGFTTEAIACNIQQCPVNGGWGHFGNYSSCNRHCGGGNQTRYRICNNPLPRYGGAYCQGSRIETRPCNTEICPDIQNCSIHYTRFESHGNGNMVYLDRHRMQCNAAGNVLSMFNLQRNAELIRYQYKCCKINGPNICSSQHKTSTFSGDGSGNTLYLDRHAADCGMSGFISNFKVERDVARGMVRYNYMCCDLSRNWASLAQCYYGHTGFSYDGNGRIYYLDRQTVSCNSGYALSYFRLQRNSAMGDRYRYHYRCCKVNY